MSKIFKNRLAIVISAVACVLLVFAVSSCRDAFKQRSARQKEIAVRMDAEEGLDKAIKEKNSCLQKAAALTKDLESGKAALAEAKKALGQEQLINQSLKEELQKVSRVKEALEDELKNALLRSNKSIEDKSTK